MNSRSLPWTISLLCLILGGAAGKARAQVDPWEFEVYPYATLSRGTIELETDNAVVTNGHSVGGDGTSAGTFKSQGMWYNQFELTYGLTDRIEAAAYLNMAHPSASEYRYAGSKYRLRGRLFDEDVLPVNLGWYAEIEWHKTPQFDDSDLEVELRPILEKDFGRFSLMIDPIFEKSLVGAGHNQGFLFGYANGAYYSWLPYLSPGVEFYGGVGLIDDSDPLNRQQHYVFPVVWGHLPYGFEYNLGPGFGMTRGSDHVVVKFNLEIERFIGALFGPSRDNGWFF
ncbi:MAG TPA: hypothetical protein VJN94_08215 [Candidatus Binataceae bacterium]|nr:hypothetical protein [Candidatus Binataceae bacterium]